jgi:hypothetical protein
MKRLAFIVLLGFTLLERVFPDLKNRATTRVAPYEIHALFTSSPNKQILEPRMYLLYGFETGDPVRVYFERTQKPEFKTLRVPGLTLKHWDYLTAFGKDLLELEFKITPNMDAEFDSVIVTDNKNTTQKIYVGPSRIMYLKPKKEYEINFELMEQIPNQRLFLGINMFNDSAQTVTIEQLIYAPKTTSTNQILLNSNYDPKWFTKLEAWSKTNNAAALPLGSSFANSSDLNLKLKPGKGFSAAVVAASFQAKLLCQKGLNAKLEAVFLQPVVKYRVGNGKSQLYPIPDNVQANVCL